jgi:hypothetical protein
MLLKYRPEDKAAKKERLLNKAKAEADGKAVETKKPIVVKYGLNHVTYLIEQVCNLDHNIQLVHSLTIRSGFLVSGFSKGLASGFPFLVLCFCKNQGAS